MTYTLTLPHPLFTPLSTFHPATYQSSINFLQPINEIPLPSLSPLPPLPLSTSLLSFFTTPRPPRSLPLSTSLFNISTPDTDPFLSSVALTTSSSVHTLIPVSFYSSAVCNQPPISTSLLYHPPIPSSQSPTATLQSTNTQTQSSSSSSGDGSLFRQRGSQAAQPDETGRVPPYVDFSQFYRLWGSDHSDGQGTQGGLGPQ